MALDNFNAIAALTGSFAIRVNASASHVDLYEHTPAEGTLLNQHPAAMFTDRSVYWIERLRGTATAPTDTDDNGDTYSQVPIDLHRGNSLLSQSVFLGGLDPEWSWVLINETTMEWVMWPANAGFRGSGFASYRIIPPHITDTTAIPANDRKVHAFAANFDTAGLTAAADFSDALPNAELVAALIPNNTFRPFADPPADARGRVTGVGRVVGRPAGAAPVLARGAITGVGTVTGRPAGASPHTARGTVTGVGTLTGRPVGVQPPGRPGPPRMLDLADAGHAYLTVEWDAPADDGGSPITGYETRVGTGLWAATGSTATTHRIGGLTPGAAYTVAVRAVNSAGAGAASAALIASTLPAVPPSPPRHLAASPTGQRSIDLTWDAPLSDGGVPVTGYEVCVIDEFGTPEPFRPSGAATSHRVRGLAFGHNYGFRVRAVNSAGPGAQTGLVHETPVRRSVLIVPPGEQIPLVGAFRQELIVRLGGVDCGLLVWWQPDQAGWYASLEVPVGTAVVRGRRLAVNAGLLGQTPGVLAGDVVCRAIDADHLLADPGLDSWTFDHHGLFWELA